MDYTVLTATARSGNAKKVRAEGFIPGVLNRSDTTSQAVQFKSGALNKVIVNHGSNAKIWIEMDEDKTFGFVKEIQRHPVEGSIIHVAIQLVSMDETVKMQLPIAFHGRESLDHRSLLLQIIKSEIEVEGKTTLIPEYIVIDLSESEDGTVVTPSYFDLPEGVTSLDAEDETYAVIKTAREMIIEEAEEAEEETEDLETEGGTEE